MAKEKEWGVDIGCIVCEHLNLNTGTCKAFLKEIPHPILSGAFDHRKKFPKQSNKILFKLIED